MSESLSSRRDYEAEFIRAGNLSGEEQIAYFEDRTKKITDGEPTWMARNFESEGMCFDFFVNKQSVAQLLIGGIEGIAFETLSDDPNFNSGIHFTVEDAVQSVEKYFIK